MDVIDDIGLDEEIPDLARDAPLRDALARLRAQSFLPTLDGGRACWVVRLGGRTGSPLAVLAQQWYEPRYLVDAATPVAELAGPDADEVTLFFEHRPEADPDEVYAELADAAG